MWAHHRLIQDDRYRGVDIIWHSIKALLIFNLILVVQRHSMSGIDTIIFRGTNAIDCEDFIQRVNAYAFANHRSDDKRWIAAFALSRMSGPVLRWFSEQEEPVQNNWGRLSIALLRRFPSTDGGAEPPPYPLSTEEQQPNPIVTRTGRIKVAVDDPEQVFYLSGRLQEGYVIAKKTPDKYLKVHIEPSFQFCRLEVEALAPYEALGIHWLRVNPQINLRSSFYARLVATRSSSDTSVHSSSKGSKGPVRALVFQVSTDGTNEITTYWICDDGVTVPLSPLINPSGGPVFFTPNIYGYMTAWPDELPCRLIFEPLA